MGSKMTPELYFVITENCNLQCKHCYLEAGPGKKDTTISEEDFRKVIKNLPNQKSYLCLSGGEIFTIKDKLYDFLDYINFENKQRAKKNQGKLDLTVQTNAFWATSDEQIQKILSELKSFNVNYLDISSHDEWHFEQGIKQKNLERVLELNKEFEFLPRIRLRGAGKKIFPIGRAKNVKDESQNKIDYNSSMCLNNLRDYDLNIDQKGNVWICCFQYFKLKGNVINEPLTRIVRRAQKNPRMHALDSGGIRKLARHDGWSPQDIKYLTEKHGRCGFCYLHCSNE